MNGTRRRPDAGCFWMILFYLLGALMILAMVAAGLFLFGKM